MNILKNKKGMSLVELLIAMFILGIVMTGMSAFFAYIWKAKAVEISRGRSILIASNSVNKMTKIIRKSAQADSGAYMIESGDDFEIVFYSDTDNDGYKERVHYYLDGNVLKMGIAEPILGTNPTYPVGDEEVIEIATDVVNNPSTEPIFYYYDNTGTLMTTPSNVYSVKSIKVLILINTDPEKIDNIEISSKVALRNVNT